MVLDKGLILNLEARQREGFLTLGHFSTLESSLLTKHWLLGLKLCLYLLLILLKAAIVAVLLGIEAASLLSVLINAVLSMFKTPFVQSRPGENQREPHQRSTAKYLMTTNKN